MEEKTKDRHNLPLVLNLSLVLLIAGLSPIAWNWNYFNNTQKNLGIVFHLWIQVNT